MGVNTNELSEEERWRKEHEEMHRKHMGHDVMHAEMFLIFIVSMIVSQIILMIWKKKHVASYQKVTLVGLWIIPFMISFHKFWWRFLLSWAIFTAASSYIWYLQTRQIISGKTPRLVYKYFLFLHKMSYVLGIIGYIAIILTLIGVNLIFGIKNTTSLDFGVYVLFYGVYYGVLGRDFAQICTENIACKIGYYTPDGLPKRILESGVCGVCGNQIDTSSTNLNSYPRPQDIRPTDVLTEAIELPEERSYTLSCNHVFHEFCIRGWCVIGKLQTCPYCKEKVDLKLMFKNPWEKPHLFYGQFLDWVRYLVAWQPLIVMFVHGLSGYFGLE